MRTLTMALVCLCVLPATAQTITVISPNGGEAWAQGAPHPITWRSSGMTGSVRIILFNGAERVGIIRDDVPVASGAIDWAAGEFQGGMALPGSSYRIRVRSLQSSTVLDESDHAFTITAGASEPPTTPAPPTTPPGPVAPSLASVPATAKIPPRLLWFAVNGGEEVTTDMHVRFPFRAMGGASHYRFRINPDWEDWQPLAPGGEAGGLLLAFSCSQVVHFQVKNAYGVSNVLSDGITFHFPENRVIAASAACAACSGHGWTFKITSQDCNRCAYLLPYPLDGVIQCQINSLRGENDPVPQGHKCEFELFGGRTLKEGWQFVSYELVPPQGIGAGRENGCAILQQPSPGARDITLRIRLWHDILRYADGIVFTVRSITLKGPCDRPPSEAFE